MATILIVDDEDSLLEMMAIVVEELGHQPLLATNGQEALNILESQPALPALILCDAMMPRMSGWQLARAVRNTPALQAIPIILMSAAETPDEDLQADRFLPKPFTLQVLAEAIEQYVPAQA